jgi:hypothetical protein
MPKKVRSGLFFKAMPRSRSLSSDLVLGAGKLGSFFEPNEKWDCLTDGDALIGMQFPSFQSTKKTLHFGSEPMAQSALPPRSLLQE